VCVCVSVHLLCDVTETFPLFLAHLAGFAHLHLHECLHSAQYLLCTSVAVSSWNVEFLVDMTFVAACMVQSLFCLHVCICVRLGGVLADACMHGGSSTHGVLSKRRSIVISLLLRELIVVPQGGRGR